MLEDLQAIVEHRTRIRPPLESLRERFGPGWKAERPADMLDFAITYCRLAVPLVRPPDGLGRTKGADSLLRFIADLPPDLERAIRAIEEIIPVTSHAWEEPVVNAYVSLCCTVHDIWAHLLGPESDVDDRIFEELKKHAPCNVYDFGAGTGHFVHELAAVGCHVEMDEIDPVKREFVLFRMREAGLSGRLLEKGIIDRHDLALAINVLDHLEVPASAVDKLAARLRPGGILATVAEFPRDGWHQSDVTQVQQYGAALWQKFVPTGQPDCPIPWYETFRRRYQSVAAVSHDLRPKLNPNTVTTDTDSDGNVVLIAPNAYSRGCELNAEAAEVFRHFDGKRTMHDVALEVDVEESEVVALCEYLAEARHVYWCEPDVVTESSDEASGKQ
jgi:SAM-dependent methyltransferase